MASALFLLATPVWPVAVVIGLTGIETLTEEEWRRSAGPTSIFPFRLGWQAIVPVLGSFFLALGQPTAKFLGVIPGHIFHGKTPHVLPGQLGPAFSLGAVLAGIGFHDGLVFFLGDFMDAHVEGPTDLDPGAGAFVFDVPFLVLGRTPEEFASRDHHPLHADGIGEASW